MAPLMGGEEGGSGSGVPVAALFPDFSISGAFFVKLFGMDVFLGFQGSSSRVPRFQDFLVLDLDLGLDLGLDPCGWLRWSCCLVHLS